MKISIIGLTLSSSWGNGHATTWRSLVRAMRRRGHSVSFFERREPWYASNRDFPCDGGLHFYSRACELLAESEAAILSSDLVIIGSFVRETSLLVSRLKPKMQGALAFYDIDTPATLAALKDDRCPYLERELVPQFDLYLSFAGGAALDELEALGAPRARPLYCSADPAVHTPREHEEQLDLGYLGTYAADRHAALTELLIEPAQAWSGGRFSIAGPQYPDADRWPGNVEHIDHVPPTRHSIYFSSQRYTLNVTRADMRRMGHAPSVRLFEAAACGTAIISDDWPGLGEFFEPNFEILTAATREEMLRIVRDLPEDERLALGAAARGRVHTQHTGEARVAALEDYVGELT